METDTHNDAIKCGYTAQRLDTTQRQQVYDKLCLENGTTKVNQLDKKLFNVSDAKLTEFLEHYEDSILNVKQKGKSYMIMDNFLEYVGLTREDLLGARAEAEQLAGEASLPIAGSKRVDVAMWLRDLQQSAYPSLGKLEAKMLELGGKMNNFSQNGDGDRTKRVDKLDV